MKYIILLIASIFFSCKKQAPTDPFVSEDPYSQEMHQAEYEAWMAQIRYEWYLDSLVNNSNK